VLQPGHNRKSYLLAVTWVVCATMASTDMASADDPAFTSWGKLGARRLDGDCPKIDGTFSVVGEPDKGNSTKGEVAIYALLFHPRAREVFTSMPLRQPTPRDERTLQVVQDAADSFTVAITAADGNSIRKAVFDRRMGDFKCADGFVTLTRRFDFSSEGVRGSSHVELRITSADDGSLVLVQRILKQNRAFPAMSERLEINSYRFRSSGDRK